MKEDTQHLIKTIKEEPTAAPAVEKLVEKIEQPTPVVAQSPVTASVTYPTPIPAPLPPKPVIQREVLPVIPQTFAFDKGAVLYLIYLLYRKNIIARNNLRELLEEVQQPVPANLTEWLVKESMR